MRKNLFGAIALLLLSMLLFVGCSTKSSITKVDKLKDKSELNTDSKEKLNIELKEKQSIDVKTITKNDIDIVNTDSSKTIIHKETKYEIVKDKDGNPISLPISDRITEEHFNKSTKATSDKSHHNIKSHSKTDIDLELDAVKKSNTQINNDIKSTSKSDSTIRKPNDNGSLKSKISGYLALIAGGIIALILIYLYLKSKA